MSAALGLRFYQFLSFFALASSLSALCSSFDAFAPFASAPFALPFGFARHLGLSCVLDEHDLGVMCDLHLSLSRETKRFLKNVRGDTLHRHALHLGCVARLDLAKPRSKELIFRRWTFCIRSPSVLSFFLYSYSKMRLSYVSGCARRKQATGALNSDTMRSEMNAESQAI